jgi:hypothetical protein
MTDEPPSDSQNHPLLAYDGLQPGDVLYFRALQPDLLTRGISRRIDSPYTHVAIYLGENRILEAGYPTIQIRELSEADKDEAIIGVFRSQIGFTPRRAGVLRDFARTLIDNKAPYDMQGFRDYKKAKFDFEANLQKLLELDYGKTVPHDLRQQSPYFCSGLIVACFIMVGIIDEFAELAFDAGTFSPRDLYEDPTFGWFVGYIKAEAVIVPPDDPLMNMTLWHDAQ